MRVDLPLAMAVLFPTGLLAQVCEIRWPDADIAVPSEVQAFIASECHESRGSSEEDMAACIAGEAHGYRATVMMLMDAQTGEMAADLYRACRSGPGAEGGRFHRQRAECMGSSLCIHWRFEFTRKASAEGAPRAVDFAGTVADLADGQF